MLECSPQAPITAEFPTIHGLLAARASADPDGTAYVVASGKTGEERLTYSEVDARARAIAARLTELGARGERVLLAHRSPARYVAGLFGALYAGAVPVSGHPLERWRLAGTLEQLEGIAADCGARFAIAARSTAEFVADAADEAPARARLAWLDGTEETPPGDYEPEPADDPEALAYLQYTSGSTGVAKGVELTHSNIVANLEAQRELCDMSAASRIVSWLPLSHDMGLIGPVFHPLYLGSETVLLSPATFLLRPVSWLRAITRYGGTITGAPNFAYDLCVDRVTFDELEGLDLSTLTHAVDGAEPIRPETLERFIDAFEQVGFRRSSMVPAFGLAESTCLATIATRPRRPTTAWFARAELQTGTARALAAGDRTGVELVACGAPPTGHEVVIVDAEGERLPDGRVGDVWVAGPSVARGYFDRPLETEQVFGATLRGEPGRRFLRTGDQGLRFDGELFITGRAKDLIIIRGQNHAPDHVERTAQESHGLLERHAGAAFSIDVDGQEQLAIVHELRAVESQAEAANAIRAAISREHGLRAAAVVLLAPGALPKTPSGKIRRRDCRRLLETGALDGIVYADGPFATAGA